MVLLDRDGTLNVRRTSHVHDVHDLELLPGVGEAVALAAALGRVVLVTNQQSVGRGDITSEGLDAVNAALVRQLSLTPGARVDAIYVCPHLAGTCDCRKPGTGLFLQALREAPDVLPAHCAVIGDQPSDVEPGLALGMLAFHVVHEAESAVATPAGAFRVGSALEAMTMLAGLPGWAS
ncbi:D-glycero-alpha-D-manno-heptose-1,7-bisphosphate 7-phosphatase [Aeromicrobium wangtongii]|uniref:D,D-heptose 1,7-bisphosphate phosphatase n=1 Tax=Aeromicrobium wangtongii TaxID=2969247 RepID=A0ABY5MD20_9ACTN|nr:HAD-IIIA family hydrolase [Aeromicrobium wangtongii]MCD9197626.1 HAD-IIIA family hydrolase [Aeromicrobium wangtongii]UUP15114.1 HAD-IIIA family hydrolase [Aeromicrobium wangtongii]